MKRKFQRLRTHASPSIQVQPRASTSQTRKNANGKRGGAEFKLPAEVTDPEKPIEDLFEEVAGGLFPKREPWHSLADIMTILHHPDFYWGALGNQTELKYLKLHIDTRTNDALVSDRYSKPVDLKRVWAGIEKPTLKGMNSNPRLALLPVRPVTPDEIDGSGI